MKKEIQVGRTLKAQSLVDAGFKIKKKPAFSSAIGQELHRICAQRLFPLARQHKGKKIAASDFSWTIETGETITNGMTWYVLMSRTLKLIFDVYAISLRESVACGHECPSTAHA
jgi:hypothetical protein